MITVIADDITGAAEIAGVCLRYGLQVIFGIDTVPTDGSDIRIIATDSRSVKENEAYSIHKKLALEIYKDPNALVFKKCDSVLRGFVLTELIALMDVTGKSSVLLQPSNPATDRCIREGIYYIADEKIEDTGFSKDPDFPAISSDVKNLLLQRSTYENNNIEIHTGLITEIGNTGIFVPDCTSPEELQACCALINDKTLLCGSAAFFEQFLLYNKIGKRIEKLVPFSVSTSFLMICGSIHPQSRKFQDKMAALGCPVHYFPTAILQENITNDLIESWATELIDVWKKNLKLVLAISTEKIEFPKSSLILKSRMNLIAAEILKKCKVDEVFIEGGATAYGILNLLDWKTLSPVQELGPGVVRMKVSNQMCHLTIKPGSYQWPEYMVV